MGSEFSKRMTISRASSTRLGYGYGGNKCFETKLGQIGNHRESAPRVLQNELGQVGEATPTKRTVFLVEERTKQTQAAARAISFVWAGPRRAWNFISKFMLRWKFFVIRCS